MNENEFATIQYIVSYPGVLFLVWIATQMLKNLVDRLRPQNSTKYLVLIFTILFVTISKVFFALQVETWTTIAVFGMVVEWIANILIVWTAVMKTHELLKEQK